MIEVKNLLFQTLSLYARDGRGLHLEPREWLRLAGNASACSSTHTTSLLWHEYWRVGELRNKAKSRKRIPVPLSPACTVCWSS